MLNSAYSFCRLVNEKSLVFSVVFMKRFQLRILTFSVTLYTGFHFKWLYLLLSKTNLNNVNQWISIRIQRMSLLYAISFLYK